MIRYCLITFFLVCASLLNAQTYSQGAAIRAKLLWPDSTLLKQSNSESHIISHILLKGIERVWMTTGNGMWFDYIKRSVDATVNDEAVIHEYKFEANSIDYLNYGQTLLTLYRVTGNDKYRLAADQLHQQLVTQPRSTDGGFLETNSSSQIRLDNLFTIQPFYAEYAQLFHVDTAFDDIVRQFKLAEKTTLDPKTGLLYYGWNKQKQSSSANTANSLSLGMFGMALVDVLDYYPQQHPKRKELLSMLQRFAIAIRSVQNTSTGLWHKMPGVTKQQGQDIEVSGSCMLAYVFAKASRLGYLSPVYGKYAAKTYNSVKQSFVENNTDKNFDIKNVVVGNDSFKSIILNDPIGIGSFMLCSAEIEMQSKLPNGKNKLVLLDTYFNNEWKKDATGRQIKWHYTWDDRSNSGFHFLGQLFEVNGARTASLPDAPAAENLAKASVYIIVDPDTEKETASPNYMQPGYVASITQWVRDGGVLVMLTNDAVNCELERFNQLSMAFGIRFNINQVNLVKDDQFEQGAVLVPKGNAVFPNANHLFIKEMSSIQIKPPAMPLLQQGEQNIMAVAKLGKGWVFALGDPWLYNEYVDGRKLPLEYDNYTAAQDLVCWLLKNAAERSEKKK